MALSADAAPNDARALGLRALDGHRKRHAASLWERLLDIRYEDGAWSLLRADRGLRYTLKSLAHVRSADAGARVHFSRMRRYHATRCSPRGGADPKARTLRIAAVGDLMWIPAGWERALAPELERVLAGADLRFANLETPVDDRRAVPRWTYARYNAPATFLGAWHERVGPTVFSLVNNHALDQGLEGFLRSRSAVESHAGHVALGGAHLEQACRSVDCRGVRVGVIGLTYDLNPWHHHLRPDAYPAGIPRVHFGSRRHRPDWALAEALIARARAAGAELIVLLPHWGHEFEYWPDTRCRADAYRLVELGVDVILGSSPHVLQPVEIVSVDGWDPGCPVQLSRGGPPRAAVVAHSLGNFTSSLPTAACNAGAVLELTLRLGTGGTLDLVGLSAVPTVSERRPGWRRDRHTRIAGAARDERKCCHWERLLVGTTPEARA